jgi:Ca-activated chloride channel family protein
MKKGLIVVVILILAAVAHFMYKGVDNVPKPGQKGLSYQEAVGKLSDLVKNIHWTENIVQRRAKIQLGQKQDWKSRLPEIEQFKLVINPPDSPNEVIPEIFVSTEKSGDGTDGLIVEIARDFNAQNKRLSNGKIAKVKIRKIASGTAYEFIASEKYQPDGFSPSNQLWVEMAGAHGVKLTPIRKQWIGNIAGIVMKTSAVNKLKTAYGNADVKTIIDAVAQGKLVMGYTDPFASSTGLNFLITVLATFAAGDPAKMLSPEVVSSFETFQRGVPFVALTTIQMRESVENDGSLEAFVMEYQTYINTPSLKAGYEFIPFGPRHDNPLYGIGNISSEKKEVLEAFAAFAEQNQYKQVAAKYGFNPPIKYEPSFQMPDGKLLVQAQTLWKEKKDAGRHIAAIFLCDISGSMAGDRISQLKKALLGGSEFISPENSIGLVVFNQQVSLLVPVKKFDLPHKAAFFAAVEDMDSGGKTAMYDGIAVSLHLLLKEKEKDPNTKLMLFVLTDGETNVGLEFSNTNAVIRGIQIPIYTIGYEANISELQRLSSLVEAASMNAGEGDIRYKIGTLLNAQM